MLVVSLKKGMVRSGGSGDCSASRAGKSGWSVAQSKTGEGWSQIKIDGLN